MVRVNTANKSIYDAIIEGESILTVNCNYLSACFELVSEEEPSGSIKESVILTEYATREVTSLVILDSESNDTIDIETVFAQLSVDVPVVLDFKTTLLEELWLEGIPSDVIKAKEFVHLMKEGTAICLLGINETFSSYTEIKQFYDELDKHCGVDITNSGIKPAKPQLMGVINVDRLSYREYTELTARYPDVTINAKQIISTVKFYSEYSNAPEAEAIKTVNLALDTTLDIATNTLTINGQTVLAPAEPEKPPIQSHYYTFDCWKLREATYSLEGGWTYEEKEPSTWTEEVLITGDARIDALYLPHLQRYSVTFDTDSDIISIDEAHRDLVVEYGSTISRPQPLNVPTALKNSSDLAFKTFSSKFFACRLTSINSILSFSSSSAIISISFSHFRSCQYPRRVYAPDSLSTSKK